MAAKCMPLNINEVSSLNGDIVFQFHGFFLLSNSLLFCWRHCHFALFHAIAADILARRCVFAAAFQPTCAR